MVTTSICNIPHGAMRVHYVTEFLWSLRVLCVFGAHELNTLCNISLAMIVMEFQVKIRFPLIYDVVKYIQQHFTTRQINPCKCI